MRSCPKCKNVIENDNAKFCKKCGCKLKPIPTKEQEEIITGHLIPEESAIRRDSDSGIILGSNMPSSSSKHILDSMKQNKSIQDYKQKKQHLSGIAQKMTMFNAVKTCFSKYVKFEGKASRSEYWYFWLFSFCIETIPITLAFIIDKDVISLSLLAVSFLYCIVSFLPMLSAAIRRLHDVGKSGAYFFVSFIPFVGGLILLYFLCQKGNENFDRS